MKILSYLLLFDFISTQVKGVKRHLLSLLLLLLRSRRRRRACGFGSGLALAFVRRRAVRLSACLCGLALVLLAAGGLLPKAPTGTPPVAAFVGLIARPLRKPRICFS